MYIKYYVNLSLEYHYLIWAISPHLNLLGEIQLCHSPLKCQKPARVGVGHLKSGI